MSKAGGMKDRKLGGDFMCSVLLVTHRPCRYIELIRLSKALKRCSSICIKVFDTTSLALWDFSDPDERVDPSHPRRAKLVRRREVETYSVIARDHHVTISIYFAQIMLNRTYNKR